MIAILDLLQDPPHALVMSKQEITEKQPVYLVMKCRVVLNIQNNNIEGKDSLRNHKIAARLASYWAHPYFTYIP